MLYSLCSRNVWVNGTLINCTNFSTKAIYRESFMESAGVRYLRTRWFCIRNLTRSLRSLVRFLIRQQLVRKYRTKHFPCGIVFIIYILRHSSFGGLFTLNLSKMRKFAATHLPQKDNKNEVSSF